MSNSIGSPLPSMPRYSAVRSRADTTRTISPMMTNAITPMSMGILPSSSGESFSGTMVAMMASTSSTTGTHATTSATP